MNMNAVFPLTMVRQACRLSARGFRDSQRFSLPPLLINEPAASFVSCGSKPLARCVSVSGSKVFQVANHCYIDCDGGFVFPG